MTVYQTIQSLNLTPDERYWWDERLGMMCGSDVPSVEQIELVVKQLADERKRNEIQKELPI